jgi:hypothetical protein
LSNGTWQGGHNANGAVDVIDLSAATPSIVKTVTLSGAYPSLGCITPDGKKAFIMDVGTLGFSFKLYTIDLTIALASWALTSFGSNAGSTYNVQDVIMQPNGTRFWVADTGAVGAGGSNQLWPVSVTLGIGTPLACSSPPASLAMSSNSTKMWAACSGANKLFRVDLPTQTIDHTTTFTGTSNGGGSAYPVTMTPDNETLLWSEGGPPGHLWFMDTNALSPTDTGVAIPGFGSYIAGQGSIVPVSAAALLTGMFAAAMA